MAITFDGATQRIVLDSTAHTASEIWSRWCDWHGAHTEWPVAMSQVGGDDLGGGLFIPIYIFLENGWRVRPMEASHSLVITGNLFVNGGGIPVVQTLGTYNVSVQYTVPVQAQAMSTSGASAPTAEQNAAAILAAAQVTPIQSISQDRIIEGALTEAEAQRVMLSALAGKVTKSGTNIKFKSVDGLTDRIDGTVDDLGNRTAVTLNGG